MPSYNKNNNTSIQQTVDFLKSAIAPIDEFISLIEVNGGWLPLNDKIIVFLSKLSPAWCTLYDDKDFLDKLSLYLCFDENHINDNLIFEFISDATKALDEPESSFKLTEAEIKRSIEEFAEYSESEQYVSTQLVLHSIYAFITLFFNYLALMVHGRSMCQLVMDAMNGDDEAFRLAVQIDRTVLQHPYFQQRLLKSQFSNDQEFLNKLAARLRNPILRSKFRYRTLWLTFAMLEDQNMLDLPHEQLLDILEEVGVTGDENGINDTDKLRKRLHEYRKKARM